jgi:uncharacterized YigZ family protein
LEESFRTLASESRHETDKVKGSRFVATVAPAGSADQAQEFLTRVRRELHDARHHGSAWRIRGGEFRYSDDGEPSGSTGKPILAAIDGRELVNVVVVVTRWFGGTKLGVGGLMRAYGGAASEALDRAELVTVTLERRFRLAYPYECSGPMQGLLAEQGLTPTAADYGAEVTLELSIPLRACEGFLSQFKDRTAGRGQVQEL